jgi:hypothetical protein
VSASARFREVVTSPVIVGGLAYITVFLIIALAGESTGLAKLVWLVERPTSAAWVVLVAAQVAIWVAATPPLLDRLRHYDPHAQTRPAEIIGVVCVLLLLFGLFMISQRAISDWAKFPVELHKTKVRFVTVLGFVVALGCMLGIRAAAIASQAATAADGGAASAGRFRRITADMEWFLALAGLVVTAATITTGALRQALSDLNQGVQPAVTLPTPMAVLLYGVVSSGIIALVYVPSHQQVTARGLRLVEELAPLNGETVEAWLAAHEQRAKLAAALGISTDLWSRLKGGISVLGPLIASAVALLIGQ